MVSYFELYWGACSLLVHDPDFWACHIQREVRRCTAAQMRKNVTCAGHQTDPAHGAHYGIRRLRVKPHKWSGQHLAKMVESRSKLCYPCSQTFTKITGMTIFSGLMPMTEGRLLTWTHRRDRDSPSWRVSDQTWWHWWRQHPEQKLGFGKNAGKWYLTSRLAEWTSTKTRAPFLHSLPLTLWSSWATPNNIEWD